MTNIKKIKKQIKQIQLLINLPYEVKHTLLQMFYGHTHFIGIPEQADEFVEFAIKTLKQGLFIPDTK